MKPKILVVFLIAFLMVPSFAHGRTADTLFNRISGLEFFQNRPIAARFMAARQQGETFRERNNRFIRERYGRCMRHGTR